METFKDFYKNTVVTNTRAVKKLGKVGIPHFEDLHYSDFIQAVDNIPNLIVTEKLDGQNLVAGFDSDGKFYTSRESKRGSRFYSPKDYGVSGANNSLIGAHCALENIIPQLKSIMENGDACEVEVLFGRQPNAIVYGSNRIAFLRMIIGDNRNEPDQSKIKAFESLPDTTIKAPVVFSTDGLVLESRLETQSWKFSSVPYMDIKLFEEIDVSVEIDAFKKWLSCHDDSGYSFAELIDLKLNRIPVAERAHLKNLREEVTDASKRLFKLYIKEMLLKVIKEAKPLFRDVKIAESENLGIEGVVFLDPQTQSQFKLVNKDEFTVVNGFNFAIRRQLKSPSRKSPVFEGTSLGLDVKEDIFNEMLFRISEVFGIKALGHVSGIKTTLLKYKGEVLQETAQNFADVLEVKNHPHVKTNVLNFIDDAIDKLLRGLKVYNENWQNYETTLSSGRQIRYNDEIHSRNLIIFSELKGNLNEMRNMVLGSTNISEIIISIYGNKLREIH